MKAVEIWEDRPGAARRAVRRLRDSARARLRPVRGAWNRLRWPAPSSSPNQPGPSFPIDGEFPTLAELEAIIEHPQIGGLIEAPPAAPLQSTLSPPPKVPRGAERLSSSRRSAPARVIDIVPMGIELDMLELRLLHLYDLVDRFIVFESPRAFGGPVKPLFLQRNLARFARFRDKLDPVVVADTFADRFPGARKQLLHFGGEDAIKNAFWLQVREQVSADPNAIVLWGDLDELPSRDVVHWLRTHAVRLPVRLRTAALRYRFGLRDREADTDIVAFHPASVGDPGCRLRRLPGPVIRSRGTVHLTSFLPPLGLVAKLALATEWDPGVLPFVRNEHGETAAMIASGRWFERRMSPYDAEADPDGLVPWIARANRDRYASFWQSPRHVV